MDYQAKTNWTYNDTVTEQDMNRIEAGLGDLHQRLDTPATSKLVLQPGTQTIQMERDTPFHLSGISGRMLLNLLGREGGFEQLPKFFFSTTGSLDTTNKVSGTNGLKLTINNNEIGYAGLPIYNPKLGVNGAKYLIRGAIKNGNLSGDGAYLQITDTVAYAENSPLIKSTDRFVNCFALYDGTKSKHNTISAYMAVKGQSGQYAYFDEVAVYEISNEEYMRLSSLSADEVAAQYPYTEGLAGVKNPYTIRWTSSSKTDVAAMLAFDTELLASPVPANDVERDRLEQGVDGQYVKNSLYYRYPLLGEEINIITSADFTGYKWIRLRLPVAPVKDTGYMLKYDGSILARVNQGLSPSKMDQQVVLDATDSTPNSFIVTISNTDSGWGDNYSPSVAEIKAYFFGWKMYDASTNSSDGLGVYNGSNAANKRWTPLASFDGSTYSGNVSVLPGDIPSVVIPNGYRVSKITTPYELIYKRSSVISEPLASEGAMSFIQGTNIIEIGSGLVIRETANPQPSSSSFWINGAITPSILKNRVRSFLQIYRDGRPDSWNYLPTNNFINLLGLQQAQISMDRYDSNATYSVSYLPLQSYAATSFVGSTAINERAIIDGLIRDMQRTKRRISVVESRKVEKDSLPSWISPTLLNSWGVDSTNPIAYRKKDNMISLTGVALNGVTSVGTIIFKLPNGYRPKQENHFSSYTYKISDGTFGLVEIITRINGDVVLGQGAKSYVSFAGINFSIT